MVEETQLELGTAGGAGAGWDQKQTAPRPRSAHPLPPPQLVVGLKSFVPESEASERLSQGITGKGELFEVQLARNYPNQGKNNLSSQINSEGSSGIL